MSCAVELPPTSTSYSEQRGGISEEIGKTVFVSSQPSKPKVLAIVPCRSGSKGLPGKNIKQLNGVPLMGYAIKPALECPLVDRVIVDTDDEGYAAIAQKLGADVPFLRPKHLAEDVPTEDVIIHALDWLQEHQNQHYDIVVTLQCTTPGIKPSEIEALIKAVNGDTYNSAATVCEISERPEWMFKFADESSQWLIRHLQLGHGGISGNEGVRQSLPDLYRLTGAGYATRTSALRTQRSLLAYTLAGVKIPRERSQDIDTLFDFRLIEKMMPEW